MPTQVANVRTDLDRLARKKVNCLIIIEVHARDIIDSFVRDSILDGALPCVRIVHLLG